ncbi:MAG: inositol monophosphatase family protein [Terriglobales bacterium]
MNLRAQRDGLQSLFPAISEVLRGAGTIVRRYFGQEIDPSYKGDGTPVTQADLEAEAYLRDRLGRIFPNASVLGEEYGETPGSGPLRWVIDPIDGTRSFLMGTPLFGTLVALEKEGVPILGAIYLPIQDQLMIGSAETGTFVNGHPVHVSRVAELESARLVVTDPADLLEETTGGAMAELGRSMGLVRGFGDCYGYFLVARGSADVMVDLRGVHYYDVAPMLPILQGAGGAFSAIDGSLDFAAGNALATNGWLHDEARKILCRGSRRE